MATLTLAGLCGSLRAGSYNRMLMHEAARFLEPDDFVVGDPRLPLFDEDDESVHGIPGAVQSLAVTIARADAVVIACPEYNKAPPGVLKNALDWISRVEGNPWRDKPVALVSATGGRAGGERTQFALRLMMVPFRPRLLQGPEVLVGGAKEHFDTDGRLVTESYRKLLDALMEALRTEAETRRLSG
ncbi:NADPH-dependent FMN reductase [Rhodobacteraceae bacterium WD3A24]|nr:NADPH-dependent FMN reductase [Rhodobacteraceae bacterium WD3A24]